MWLILKTLVLAILVGVALIPTEAVKVSCKDEQGQDVDWFYLYKLPKHHSSDTIEHDANGFHYLYITSNSYEAWQRSTINITAPESMPALTLSPLFVDPTVLLVAYNDEFPNGTVFLDGGHTKGVVATDGITAIWLVHSVPKFPSIPHYEYPATGARYGQSFLCLTLPATEIDKVGTQLIYNEPNIYFSRLPVMLNEKFPFLESAIKGERRMEPPFDSLVELTTLANAKFKSFAKSTSYQKDLYEDFVAPTLDVNLLVETWRNGEGNMASNCSKAQKVYNIAEIEAPELQLSFRTTSDHSKWAVAETSGLKIWRWRVGGGGAWVCVGDINRQQHQLVRGGGTVCQRNAKLAKLYRDMIKSFDACAKRPLK